MYNKRTNHGKTRVINWNIFLHVADRKLQAIKRRLISDTEIPLAIFHCSTEMYCNSKFEFAAFLKAKAQTCPTSDVVIIEDTQNTIDRIDKGERIKEAKVIAETCVSQDDERTLKDARLLRDESAPTTREDANGRGCDIAAKKIARNAKENQGKVTTREVIPETRESQVDDAISRNVRFRKGDGQTDVASASESNVTASDVFCGKIQKRLEIINLESCCHSSGKGAGKGRDRGTPVSDESESESESERERASKISELSSEVNVVKDLVARKMRRNVAELQRKSSVFTAGKGGDRLLEEDAVLAVAIRDQRGDDCSTSKKNNARCTKDSLRLERDDSLNDDHKSDHESWQSSTGNFKSLKSLKRPRIVSIEQIDNSGIITIERKRGKASAEGFVKVVKEALKERELNPSRDAGRREEDEKMRKSGIREKGQEARKTVNNGSKTD